MFFRHLRTSSPPNLHHYTSPVSTSMPYPHSSQHPPRTSSSDLLWFLPLVLRSILTFSPVTQAPKPRLRAPTSSRSSAVFPSAKSVLEVGYALRFLKTTISTYGAVNLALAEKREWNASLTGARRKRRW